MKVYYDKDIDYLEIFFESRPNYTHDISNTILEFRSEKDDHVVGYVFEQAMEDVSTFAPLTPQQRIAILSIIGRKKQNLDQETMAQKLGISYRTYQRIEEGEISKIEDLITNSSAFNDIDFTAILKKASQENNKKLIYGQFLD